MKSLALALLLGLSSAGAAAQSESRPVAEPGPAPETTVITPDTAATAPRDTGCIRDTGTRLRKRDRNGCTGGPGRSYSREELDRTGASDLTHALRMLSPIVR